MLEPTIIHISDLLGIGYTIIPDIITIIIIVILLYTGLKGSLQWISVLFIYGMSMGVLTLLGIDSVFNLISILKDAITELLELIF